MRRASVIQFWAKTGAQVLANTKSHMAHPTRNRSLVRVIRFLSIRWSGVAPDEIAAGLPWPTLPELQVQQGKSAKPRRF
jgi:hypothetical protein